MSPPNIEWSFTVNVWSALALAFSAGAIYDRLKNKIAPEQKREGTILVSRLHALEAENLQLRVTAVENQKSIQYLIGTMENAVLPGMDDIRDRIGRLEERP